MSVMILMIGAAGVAGAIELGNNPVPALIITAIGAVLSIHEARKEAHEEERKAGLHTDYIDFSADNKRKRRRA